MFYEFRQNNSGGSFEGDYLSIFIEADNSEAADSIAERYDVYFDGVDRGIDCECCGDRWYRSGYRGVEAPDRTRPKFGNMYDGLNNLVVYADGTTETLELK